MRISAVSVLVLASLACLAAGAPAAEYSRRALLAGPVTLKDDADVEVMLAKPVGRRQEMAQLEIAFSTATGRYVYSRGGVSSPGGAGMLTVTLLGDDGGRYTADIVNGKFYPGGVRARFVALPPRNTALRRLILRGRNLPEILQIYWLEGREKLATGVDEDLRHCEERKCSWSEAMDYCRARGGRLLSLSELKAMHADECGAGGTCADSFWSATEYAPFPRKAWYLDFSDGKSVAIEKTYTAFVRCIVPASGHYKPRGGR